MNEQDVNMLHRMFTNGCPLRMVIQMGDGLHCYRMVDAFIANYSISADIDGLMVVDCEIRATEGSIVQESRQDLSAKRRAVEWRCDYCGSPNLRDDAWCSQCGAARSFIYG